MLALFKDNPNATGIWVKTGSVSNVAVLDCDNEETVAFWRKRLGPVLDRTARVKSPHGWHFWFWLNGPTFSDWSQTQEQLAEGVKFTVRCESGGIMAPPSHDGAYSWEQDLAEVQQMPTALGKPTSMNGQGSTSRSELAGLLDNPPAPGGRNDWTTKVAGHVFKHMPEPQGRAVMQFINANIPDPLEVAEAEKVVGSILRAEGAKEPVADRLSIKRARLLSVASLRDLPEQEPLIYAGKNPALYKRTVALFYGEPGSFKTFMALGWALTLALRDIGVLFIAAEGAYGLDKRVAAWRRANHVSEAQLEGRFMVYPDVSDMRSNEEMEDWASIVREDGYGLVVFDTLHRNTPGADENSSRDMGVAFRGADLIRKAGEKVGTTVTMIHHTGKDGLDYRGSSALEGDPDTLLKVVKSGDAVTLYHEKHKDAPQWPPVRYTTEAVGASLVLHEGEAGPETFPLFQWGLEESSNAARLFQALSSRSSSERVSAGVLEKMVGKPRSSVNLALKQLRGLGLVDSSGSGQATRYFLTDLGREVASSSIFQPSTS